jgi:hypothetical protein
MANWLKHLALGIFFLLLVMVWWSLTEFLAVWSFGEGFYPVDICVYAAWAAWNTYNILDMKLINVQFLTDSETKWGFGQVLPLVLLASIAFGMFDAIRPSGLPSKTK